VYNTSPALAAMELTIQYLNPGPEGQPRGMRIDVAPFIELVHTQPGPQGLAYTPFLPLDLARQSINLSLEYFEKEAPAMDPETRGNVFQLIKALKKLVEDRLVRPNDQYQRDKERFPKAAQRYMLARRSGLIGEAIQVVKGLKEDELGKEFGAETPEVVLQIAAQEMACGRLEEATLDMAAIKDLIKQMAAEGKPNPRVPFLQNWLRWLEYQRLLLAGSYGEAGDELEGLVGRGIGTDHVVANLHQAKIDPAGYKEFDTVWPRMAAAGAAWPLVSMLGCPVQGPEAPLGVLTNFFGGRAYFHHFQLLASARSDIAEKIQEDADFFYRRGVLSMFEGDIPAARARFEQAINRQVPPGWGLPQFNHSVAAEYLRVIDSVNKKP
jgi:hypothetical protein